jgi:hypothetical protein
MAIGIRHALSLVVFGIVIAAVWCARLRRPMVRRLASTVLAASSLAAAVFTFPDYLSYFPDWAGGVKRGYRWLADSNYDWGQDVEKLEEQWAALIKANGGQPPHLVYFGFIDPRVIYDMPAAEPSLGGFVDRTRKALQGREAYDRWLKGLSNLDGTTVASISALQLDPYGINLAPVRKAREVGWIGRCFRVSRTAPFGVRR